MYFVKKSDERKNSFLDDFNSFFSGSIFSKDLKTDIEETDLEYKVMVDVPGIDKKDISLNYEDSTLTISVLQSKEAEDKNRNYLRRERNLMSVSRSFYLEYGDESNVKAKLNDGVLEISIKKLENKTEQKKTISID